MEVIQDTDAHSIAEGQSIYYKLDGTDPDLEAVEDAGIYNFDVSCEGGEAQLRALVGCLAAQLGLTGRFIFSAITDQDGAGLGFELVKVGDEVRGHSLRGEFPSRAEDVEAIPRFS